MQEPIVRKFKQADRLFLREIACDTAFLGKPGEIFFTSREILADLLTLYFTDYEPQSSFVAEADGRVVGYLIGSKDTAILEKTFRKKILLPLVYRLTTQGALLKKKNLCLFLGFFLSWLKGEFKIPCFYADYPATLHINLKEGFRNKGTGTRLISAYLAYLAGEGIRGVRLATMSEKAGFFFREHGFSLLFQGRRSYFNRLLHKNIPLYIYGRKVP